MRYELVTLKKVFLRRMAALRRRLGDVPHLRSHTDLDPTLASVAIDAYNSWSEFGRTLYYQTLCKPLTSGGLVVAMSNTAIRSPQDATREIIRKKKIWVLKRNPGGPWKRIDEPAWGDPVTLIDGLSVLGASNLTQVASSLSNPAPIDHLRRLRNFYAHRNPESAVRALNIGPSYTILDAKHPSELLLRRAYGRSQALILDLIDDLSDAAVGCCA